MRVVVVLIALCSVASAKPASDGAAVVVVIDRELGPEKLAAVTKLVAQTTPRAHDELRTVLFGSRTKLANVVAGLDAAFRMLKASTARWRRVIVVTNGSAMLGVAPLAAKMRADGITISAVGIDGGNRVVLETIARAGKGRHYRVDAAAALAKIIVAESNLRPPPPQTYAFVFVIDRSSSMQGPKIEIAKEVARIGIELAAVDDIVSVIAFADEATTIVPPQVASNRLRMSTDIANLTPQGSTNAFPALTEAFHVLKTVAVTHKHVILITDGEWPRDGVFDLLSDMRAAKITVSAIGTPGSDRTLLSHVAAAGDGLFLVAGEPDAVKLMTRIIPIQRTLD